MKNIPGSIFGSTSNQCCSQICMVWTIKTILLTLMCLVTLCKRHFSLTLRCLVTLNMHQFLWCIKVRQCWADVMHQSEPKFSHVDKSSCTSQIIPFCEALMWEDTFSLGPICKSIQLQFSFTRVMWKLWSLLTGFNVSTGIEVGWNTSENSLLFGTVKVTISALFVACIWISGVGIPYWVPCAKG